MNIKKVFAATAMILIITASAIGVTRGDSLSVSSREFSDSLPAPAASTKIVTDLRQTDAGTIDGEQYVTLEWVGTSPHYAVEQMDGEKWTLLGITNEPKVNIKGGIKDGQLISFRISRADENGEILDPEEDRVVIKDVKTVPVKPGKPRLVHWYRASDGADFSWKPDEYADGYQVRVEKPNGKKLYKKIIPNSTSPAAASGTAVSASAAGLISLKNSYRGRVACIKIRGYILINNTKKYGEWSDAYCYASAKKITLSGYKDEITVKGLKVKDVVKKEVYVSTKEKSGYKLAGTADEKETSIKVHEFGKKLIESDKTYHVRVFYYYNINNKLTKSPVYDEGKVYVEPTYLYLD